MDLFKTAPDPTSLKDPPHEGISVVVPSFNQGKFLRRALDSILNQNYPNLEILVVDGGSTDDTHAILEDYRGRIHWVSEQGLGQAAALYRGFAMATKDWLSWLNANDIQTNNALFHVNAAIKKNPETRVMIGQVHFIDDNGALLSPCPTISLGPGVDVKRELFERGPLVQPPAYVHRSAYEAVGGIQPWLELATDYDLWARLACAGFQFAGIAETISVKRWRPEAKTPLHGLPLFAELADVQLRAFKRVSADCVQAVSDSLYSVIHAKHRGDQRHLFFRTVYFKSVWIWFNCRRPFHCLWGLLTKHPSKSGPFQGDRLTWRDFFAAMFRALGGKVRVLWRRWRRKQACT